MPVERVLPSLECVVEGPSGWAYTEPQVLRCPCSLMSGSGRSGVPQETLARVCTGTPALGALSWSASLINRLCSRLMVDASAAAILRTLTETQSRARDREVRESSCVMWVEKMTEREPGLTSDGPSIFSGIGTKRVRACACVRVSPQCDASCRRSDCLCPRLCVRFRHRLLPWLSDAAHCGAPPRVGSASPGRRACAPLAAATSAAEEG